MLYFYNIDIHEANPQSDKRVKRRLNIFIGPSYKRIWRRIVLIQIMQM